MSIHSHGSHLATCSYMNGGLCNCAAQMDTSPPSGLPFPMFTKQSYGHCHPNQSIPTMDDKAVHKQKMTDTSETNVHKMLNSLTLLLGMGTAMLFEMKSHMTEQQSDFFDWWKSAMYIVVYEGKPVPFTGMPDNK